MVHGASFQVTHEQKRPGSGWGVPTSPRGCGHYRPGPGRVRYRGTESRMGSGPPAQLVVHVGSEQVIALVVCGQDHHRVGAGRALVFDADTGGPLQSGHVVGL